MNPVRPFELRSRSTFARVRSEATQLASTVTQVTDNSITAAKKTVLNGWRAIRGNRSPLASVGIAFLIAFITGTFASWFVRHW
jgi:hypothetical protein